MAIEVSGIRRYPIKSCAGHEVQTAVVGRRGIDGDHDYLVINQNNVFVTQRNSKKRGSFGISSMCLVHPCPDGEDMLLRARGMKDMWFPQSACEDKIFEARIWDDICQVQEVSPEVSRWFTSFLSDERPGQYRLVRMVDDFVRHAKAGGAEVGFHDSYPFLIASEESRTELNRRVKGAPVPMDRMRPTIILSGCTSPHEEDTFGRIRIGTVDFQNLETCDRCPMPGIDQASGKKDGRPLKALATYRVTKPDSDKVQFGCNYNHLNNGRIVVGQTVEVLS